MKYSIVLLIILFGCKNDKSIDSLPVFSPNSNKDSIYPDIKNIVREKDFNLVFFTRADLSYGWFKIFALKEGDWEKIEVRKGIVLGDSTQIEIKDVVTRKLCKKDKANDFLKKLTDLHFFDLPEEKVILDECRAFLKVDIFPDESDGPTLYLQIISDNKVRSLKFYDPQSRLTKCPSVKEWEYLVEIERIFKEEW